MWSFNIGWVGGDGCGGCRAGVGGFRVGFAGAGWLGIDVVDVEDLLAARIGRFDEVGKAVSFWCVLG